MAAVKDEFVYGGYGCPNTEMWMRRRWFEEEHPDLNHFIKKDAPHYASKATRIAYSVWESEHEATLKRLREEIAVLVESFDEPEPVVAPPKKKSLLLRFFSWLTACDGAYYARYDG